MSLYPKDWLNNPMATLTLVEAYRSLLRSQFWSPQLRNLLLSLLASGLPFLVYLRTMAPTVYGLDSAELTTGAYLLGIIHAPGSPLYLLLGHLFTWLPLGDVGYRLNLMSACTAALTALLVYQILLGLTERRFLALMATWFVAFSYYFWVSALAAELYALQACMTAGLILLGLKWRAQAQPWQLVTLAFLFGLGLGNHLSLILLGPGFAWLVLSGPGRPWRRPSLLLMATAWGLLGASIYLYLPVRHLANSPINYARDYWQVNLATWSGFWWMVSGRMFGSLFFSVPWNHLPAELWAYLYQLWSNFIGLGFLLGLAGLVTDFKRRPGLHIALSLMFAGHLLFFLTYGAGDKELMFLPTFLVWGIWFGLGTAYLCRRINQHLPETYRLFGPTLLFVFCLSSLGLNFGYVDLSQDWSARQLGQEILTELEPEAVFLGTWRDVPVLEYLQLVEGQRPDIVPVQLFFVGIRGGKKLAYEKLSLGYPVYTSAVQLLDDSSFQYQYLERCGCYQITAAKR